MFKPIRAYSFHRIPVSPTPFLCLWRRNGRRARFPFVHSVGSDHGPEMYQSIYAIRALGRLSFSTYPFDRDLGS